MPTIGVAVEVPEPWGRDLQDYRTSLGDEGADLIPTHITVLPPYDVEASLMADIEEHVRSAAAGVSEFAVELRGTGTFRPVSPVVFVAVVDGVQSCQALADGVRSGPLAVDATFPYHPHVTVAHHLADEALDQAERDLSTFQARFAVQALTLYVHQDGEGWLPRHRFPLRRN